ncbi:type I-E CRISPR-associated protein Cse1/CasA [uncultured Mailhella sp.]|uniref:type I-E CRISPR-associated protein Cse1/CasA n=1 Tax=uncultured Mailhella sp. TaxID=1981031 RepID=UPI0025E75373|nr:type I-E CRISPR-associated protein Cse1/CasA [uncultured Mailhella sp.]
MTENRFNLIDEPWIPMSDHGRISLSQAFSKPLPPLPGGTPLIKIPLLKLLLAIAQAACTPADDGEWLALGPQGLAEKALRYLQNHHSSFFLHGERPFLQFPSCAEAELKSYGTVMPEVASGNTTRLSHQQIEPELSEADRALLLIEQMSLCLGGKKPYNRLVLSPGYEKKPSGHPGPALCQMGLLHSFLAGRTLTETLWLNLLTLEDIKGQPQWEHGLGVPPWEVMPQGEDCPAARALKASLMGRLVPLARFCLLENNGLRFTEGIVHPDHLSGMADPSAAMDASRARPKMLWVDPEKRPWRQLPALLSFLDAEKRGSGFFCLGLQKGLSRLHAFRDACGIDVVGIWSGGIKVSSHAGEQYLTGKDDELESEVRLDTALLGDIWFREFESLMSDTEKRAKLLYGAVNRYCRDMKMDDKSAVAAAAEAAGLFWQMVEPTLPAMLDGCGNEQTCTLLLGRCYRLVLMLYDEACPHGTGRQVETWIKHRPRSREDAPVKHSERRHADLLQWVSERLGPTPTVRDKGTVARLRRADSSEHMAVQAWEVLIRFHVEDRDFLPCLAVLAPLCRRDDPKDGTASLGRALASCFEDKDQGSSRLRRLLNCSDMEELCRMLRPLLSFVDGKSSRKLSYARLLDEVLAFRIPERRQEIKRRWAEGYWSDEGDGAAPEQNGESA